MIPAEFEYQRVSTVDEALALLRRDPEAKLLLGGHSLLPLMKLRLARPSQLIDVSRIPELRTIDYEGDRVTVGAGIRYYEVLGDTRMDEVMPIMRQAVSVIADPQVRHRGTIGGSAAHADPASDLAAVFLATGAQFRVRGMTGERMVAASDWYVGPLMSALGSDEVLVAVEFSRSLPQRQVYVKFPHPASGYPLAGVCALVDVSADGRVTKAQIAVTGAAVMPFRASEAEAVLDHERLDAKSAAEAARVGVQGGQYADDPQYPADYRKNLARVMIERALMKVAQ